jgi:hypothetical protein
MMIKRKKYYCIRNKDGDFWDSEVGWTALYHSMGRPLYTIFTANERKTFQLPIDGYWEELEN